MLNSIDAHSNFVNFFINRMMLEINSPFRKQSHDPILFFKTIDILFGDQKCYMVFGAFVISTLDMPI